MRGGELSCGFQFVNLQIISIISLFKSENNEVVATSKLYYTKYSCKKTIDAIKARVNRNSIVVDTTE